MSKRTAPVDPKAVLDARAADLVSRTSAFCEAHLDDEYGALCAKLIGKMRRKRVVPFATGRPEIWAASVVYALGQINFMFDREQAPHTTPDTIADFFGVSKVTVGLKAKAIRDLLKLQRWDREYSTAAIEASSPFRGPGMVLGLMAKLPIGTVVSPPRKTAPKGPLLEVDLGDEEYEVLRALHVPGLEEVLQNVETTDDGVVLRLSRIALVDLVGWVAGEANHERSRRKSDLLHAICDAMEAALATGNGRLT